MGRRKKNQNEDDGASLETKGKIKLNIAGEAKRSAAAVFLFALALVIGLGFFGYAGVVGSGLDKIVGVFVGWAKFVFPLFLIIAGIVLLLRKEKSFYVTKIIGLAVILVALSGFSHWFYPISEMQKAAASGEGGGYIGYALAYILSKYLGGPGSLVIIIAIFFIGIIVAFNVSIINFLEKFNYEKNI